ncbi:accessory Sec system S-layer assembly protein [Bacillus massiliigorillae]|uniref:accessory Sec system S-layer assembly protein n=1 Tax=Bacillus massiliigorillae TaxID=1243664 RepID=UPI0003A4586C|nr:accessory Sec system S-layer assembly protein [Bacillus massiliigorillae]
MLSMFRKNDKKLKNEGKESTVSSEEILNQKDENIDFSQETEIETELSLHPSWTLSQEQGYVYRFLNNELSPLKPNQISLSGIELQQNGDNIVAIAFVRNSLNKAITFENVTLLLLDENQEPFARHEFDMSELGELPKTSSRPWQFVFPKESLMKSEFSTTDWTLAFEIKPKHALDLAESWDKSLSSEGKAQLQEIVDGLTPPKHGEVNFMGLQAVQHQDGNLHVTVLIRNGSPKSISIQQLPLQVWDASGDIVAKGAFKLDDLEVKANTTKPWTFIFPKSLVLKDELDFSSWKVAAVEA